MINAISIKEGGSLVVLKNLLREFVTLDRGIEWHVAVNNSLASLPELSVPGVTAHVFDQAERSPLHVKWWYNRTLPALIREIRADVLFSQTNYLPEVPVTCPTLLLEQHAGHFSKVFDKRMHAALSPIGQWAWRAKRRWVIRSLKRATKVTVQTQALADAIIGETGINPSTIAVIPHGPGLAATAGTVRVFPGKRVWYLGYITKYGVQKNFEVLMKAVALLKQDGVDVRLHLTLNQELPECRRVLVQADNAGISGIVVNHGELDAQKVRQLYSDIDLFVFPSLCESFGFPLLEAMAQGIPLLVADIASNNEIVGSNIFSFDAFDAGNLASKIRHLMEQDSYMGASEYMLKRSGDFSWDKAAQQTLACLLALAEENINGGLRLKLQDKTQNHYNTTPFDFMTEEDERNIRDNQPAAFAKFVDCYLKEGDKVIDVGCGPGRGTMFLVHEKMRVFSVDLSMESIALAKRRVPESRFICASNLDLPFHGESFDAVVSDGVIHHTPDARRSFSENARLVRNGGYYYVGVYRRKRYYYYLYTYLGKPMRWLEKRMWGKALIYSTMLPIYYLAHLVKSRGKRTWNGAKNFFYDYIITPQATFHTKEEISDWGRQEGFKLLDYDEHVGNVHAFVFRKLEK